MESFCGLCKKRGKANNNNLLRKKRVLLPCCCGDHPQSSVYTYKRGQILAFTSPLPCPARQQQSRSLSTAPRPTTALLCGQASLFTRRSLCVSLCVDSSCFQGMRLCAGPQGGWNAAWWECLLELCFAACVCLSAIVYLSIFLFRESHDQI